MDGKRDQEENDGPPQGALGRYLESSVRDRTYVVQWVQEQQQRQQQQLQQQQQIQREAASGLFASAPFDLHRQGSGNPGHVVGPRNYATGFAGHGQPPLPSLPPTMLNGNQPLNYNNATIAPVHPTAVSPGPINPPPLQLWTYNGSGVPYISQEVQYIPQEVQYVPQEVQYAPQEVVQQPLLPAPAGNEGNRSRAGPGWHLAGFAPGQGSVQPRNPAPPNAPNTPANIQQPAGEQPSLKRPSSREALGNQPALKRHAGEGAGGEGPLGGQPNTGNHNAAAPASAAPMTVAERLDRGLITDVAGLSRQETDELLLWARRNGIRWTVLHRRFNFQCALSTIRGRYRNLALSWPSRVVTFTERDNELVIEAVEVLSMGRLDDVRNDKFKRLWKDVQDYIKKHGGTTQAGPKTLKKKYKELTQGTSGTREGLDQSKAKQDKKSHENGKAQGQEQVSLDGGVKQEEPAGESSARDDGAGNLGQNELQWDHGEYEQYEVEHEEGVDFGDDEDDEDEDDEDPAV